MKNCKQCTTQFEIRVEDDIFYKKMSVPAPTLCPECRFKRRETFRNERVLYSRVCDKSGKSIISIFAPDSEFTVYSQDEWWKDDWEPPQADFDFSRPFFEQFRELQLKAPRLALLSKDSENSEFGNHSSRNKNCYIFFSTLDSEEIYYGMMINKCRSLTDCTYMYEESELCYECFFGFGLYGCGWCLECRNSMDLWFCYDCAGCNNCFMSSNLRNKSYVFENKQLTKEEYEKKLNALFPLSFDKTEELKKQWQEIRKNVIHKFANIINSQNVTGDYMLNGKDCYQCVHISNSEDCAYAFHTWNLKDCFDVTNTLGEFLYETHGIVGAYDNKFTNYSYDNRFVEYCDHVFNSENCFGCVGIKKGEYCILNKKYSKEDYLELKKKIIEHMSAKGGKDSSEYGEFFPSKLSPFAYNETIAQDMWPLTKNQALEKGFTWKDNVPGTRGKETKKMEDLPQTIAEIDDSITNEILACSSLLRHSERSGEESKNPVVCGKNYKIVKPELAFYKSMGLPLPRQCPDCRYNARMDSHNPKAMLDRQCTCQVSEHDHHVGKRCENKFITKYKEGAPPKKVYCVDCYKKEVL